MTTHFVVPSNPMQAGRLRKALSRQCSVGGNVRTLGGHIITLRPVRRSHYVRHYARKKRQGEYKLLNTPAHEYTVWYLGPGIRESGIDVPKIVYDALPHLATRHTEQPAHQERRRGSLVTLSPF